MFSDKILGYPPRRGKLNPWGLAGLAILLASAAVLFTCVAIGVGAWL